MKTAEIDSTNWDKYHKCGFITNDKKANPYIKDRLHLNKEGQMKVAIAVSKYMVNYKN